MVPTDAIRQSWVLKFFHYLVALHHLHPLTPIYINAYGIGYTSKKAVYLEWWTT